MKSWMGVLVAAFVAVGCSTADVPCWEATPNMCATYDTCRTANDCLTNFCQTGFCGMCTFGDDCAANEGCLGGVCTTTCTPGDRLGTGRVCDAGRVASCETVADPEAFCESCGCSTGSRCTSGTCVPLAPVDAACTNDFECASRNCSSFAGVCRVALGTTCTVANCDVCLSWTNGTSYCTGDCTATSDCGNGFCSGAYSDIPFRQCFPYCEGRDCDCRPTSGGTSNYCACDSGSEDCERIEAPHAPLEPCGYFNTSRPVCETGSCIGRAVCNSGCYIWGYCGDTCTTDAECGAEGVCGRLPCGGGTCPGTCMPRCSATGRCDGLGACQSVPGAGGAQVMACTTKLPTGAACASGEDCISALCTSRRCI